MRVGEMVFATRGVCTMRFSLRAILRMGETLSIIIPLAHVLAIEDSEHMIAVWMVTDSGER